MKKINRKIKKLNMKIDDLLFWISFAILITIGFFIFITTILQTNWFGRNDFLPVIVFISAQPYVGVFFLPFIILLSLISLYVCIICKKITIDDGIDVTRNLMENEEITKEDFSKIYDLLKNAKKQKEIRVKQEIEIKDSIQNDR